VVIDVRDTLAEVTKQTKNTLTSSAAALSAKLEEGGERLRARLEDLPESIAKRGAAAAEASFAGLKQQTEQLGSSVGALEAKVRDLKLPQDLISRRLEPALVAVEELLKTRTTTLREIVTEAGTLISRIRDATRPGEEVATVLAQIAQQLTAASRTIAECEPATQIVDELAEKLRDLDEQAERLAKIAREVNAESVADFAELKTLAAEVRELRSRMATDVSEADASLRLLHSQIVSAAGYVADSLRDRPQK